MIYYFACMCVLVDVIWICELLCGYWELNPGPLEKRPVLLNAELSLYHNVYIFLFTYVNKMCIC